MSSKDLITLTNSPVAFSDGVFQKGYTTHLNHNQFDEDRLELSWQHQSSDGFMQHQLNFIPISTGKGYENFEHLRMRAFCHLLLDYLSEEGLDEIKNSLLEAIEFYREPRKISENCYLDNSFEVLIGEGYERPVFQIAED